MGSAVVRKRCRLLAMRVACGIVLGSLAWNAAVAAPSVQGCPVTVLPNDGGTSNFERAPNLRNRFGRMVYLITAEELAAAGISGGTQFAGIGWSFKTAPGLTGSNDPLIVYFQNTTDETNTKDATWDQAIAGMTVVHDAATTIPNVTGPWDIQLSGGQAFTYSGGGLYVAFDARYPAGALSTATTVWCNAYGLQDGILGAEGGSPPTDLIPSSYRPETRLTPLAAAALHDASVDLVLAYGSLAKPVVGPQSIRAVVSNRGAGAINDLPVTLTISGAESFSDTKVVASLAPCGGAATVTFAPFTPATLGSDTLTVSVPPDDVSGNNGKSKPMDETLHLFSYKYPGTTADGGTGIAGATGAIVGKFVVASHVKVASVNLEFSAGSGTRYRVAIYPDSGSGTPGTSPLYLDAADRTVTTPGPATIVLPSPVAVGPGAFFAGIEQTNTIISNLSVDDEAPVRSGAFYFATPNPPAAWFDFSPGNDVKPNIGVTLWQCTAAADCDDGNACTSDACANNVCVHTNQDATSCDGNPCSDPDRCVNGTCVPGPNPCDDGDACTIDLCDGAGGCTHVPLGCDDNNPCTDDSCVPSTGCAHAATTGPCSDGDPCTLGDACSGGVCVPGTAPLPAPQRFCSTRGIDILDVAAPTPASPYPATIVVANQASYLCKVTVSLNGITHTFPDDIDVLLAHGTGPGAIVMSDVGSGASASSIDLTLDDAAASPLGAVLTSGTFRPTNLAGSGTEAWPAPAPAPPAAPGSALSTFNGRNPNGAWDLWVVDDTTIGAGSMSGWCVDVVAVCFADAECDDGDACTTDACVDHRCSHVAANDCDDHDACTANVCNPSTGACEHPPIVCDDGNPCTDDACDAATGCVFTADDRNTCSDGSLCTSPDLCRGGACVGQNAVVCAPDANPCTTETCDPQTGACVSIDNTDPCDDGNPCTTGDVCGPRFAESFDGVAAPDLPATWASSAEGAGGPWSTDAASSDTPPNSAAGSDVSDVGEEVLVGPPIAIADGAAQLTFRNRWSFESPVSCYDAGVLEIAIDNGTFTDIVAAGGTFVSGGYTGTVSNEFQNPLGGRSAWCRTSDGYPAYVTTVVDLPPAASGRTIRLRFRIGTDASTGGAGQNVDSIVIRQGHNTCSGGTPITAPPETTGMMAAEDKLTFTWSAAAFATSYDVVRGSTRFFPVGPGGDDEVCFGDLTAPSLADPDVPKEGNAYWYLSRGGNRCGMGSYGWEERNGEPRAPRVTTTCP
jgi:hypothetical protein